MLSLLFSMLGYYKISYHVMKYQPSQRFGYYTKLRLEETLGTPLGLGWSGPYG